MGFHSNKEDARARICNAVKWLFVCDVVWCLQQFQGLFIETSAKDGSNVLEAVTELSRFIETFNQSWTQLKLQRLSYDMIVEYNYESLKRTEPNLAYVTN